MYADGLPLEASDSKSPHLLLSLLLLLSNPQLFFGFLQSFTGLGRRTFGFAFVPLFVQYFLVALIKHS